VIPSASELEADFLSSHLDFSWAPRLLEEPVHGGRKVKVIIIGAGFSGMCAAITLQEMCKDVDVIIYDKATDVGGVCERAYLSTLLLSRRQGIKIATQE
jgi:heterodisulfide reductase subunit A-like polyferredoxin